MLQFAVPVIAGQASPAKAASTAAVSATSTSPITFNVVSARDVGGASPIHKGSPVLGSQTLTPPDAQTDTTTHSYKWMIVVDDAGNPTDSNTKCLPYQMNADGTPKLDSAGKPITNGSYAPGVGTLIDNNGAAIDQTQYCQWPSARYTPGAVAIVDQGEVFESGTYGTSKEPGTLPTGKYLVSVTANGYKIDGAHFSVDSTGKVLDANGVALANGKVTVGMQPYPLPTGTLRLQVFKDVAPVDGTYEAGVEPGLAGFVTHLNDVLGEVTTDFYGNRLCTNYVHRDTLLPTDPNYTPAGGTPHAGYSRSNYDITSPVTFDGGAPVVDANDPGGLCFSDVDGLVVIPNLGPDRYTASVIPPAGQKWYQTTTLEGNHDWDMWIHEGDTGFDHEITVGGEQVPPVDMGYVPYNTAPGATVLSAATTTNSVVLTLDPATVPSGGFVPNQTVTLARGLRLRVGNQNLNLGGFGGPGGPGGPAGNGDVTIFSATTNTITIRINLPNNQRNRAVNVSGGANAIGLPDAAPAAFAQSASGGVTGQVVEVNTYVGGKGGTTVPTELTLAGMNVRGPVSEPIVAINDLNNNDQLVYVGRGGTNGKFTVPNVPNGSYQITFWDFNQDLIINSVNVSVANGKVSDMGQQGLVDWYTDIKGKIFVDANSNGKWDCSDPASKDPAVCEQGVPKFTVTFKQRDNSLFDAGQNLTTTDDNGDYEIREAYPVTRWSILEAFNTRYKTTGITVQADNEKSPTTYLGAAVDVSVLPVIGLAGRIDWGVQPYQGAENGGIAGTVTYDTTRNELDPKYAFTEDYQPGIPNMTMHLRFPVRDANGAIVKNADGSVKVVEDPAKPGTPLDIATTYTTETWNQPTGCTARMFDGTPLTDQLALPPFGDDSKQCVEAPMMGWQGVPSDKTSGNFGQTVNGNYAFASMDYNSDYLSCLASLQGGDPAVASCSGFDATKTDGAVALPADDFVVVAESPKLADGSPLYKPTGEADINVFDGDIRMPQENYPLSSGDLSAAGASGATPGDGGPVSQQPGLWFDCAGANHPVHVTDQGFLNAGGSPYEGQSRPYCDAKLISTRGNQTVAPNFNFFTDVPLPTHFWGLTVNDLGLSHDKTQLGYGEAEPLPNVPMGIYDWSGRLVDTVLTDHNGMYEAIEPSTSSYNCPLPAGPCPGMYYFKGNDPGQPGRPNKNYNPRFRTIGTDFQAWPGLFTVTDTAPTQTSAIVLAPGGAVANPVDCSVNAGIDPSVAANATKLYPEIYSVDHPYVTNSTGGTTTTVTPPNERVSAVTVRPSNPADDPGLTQSTVTLTVTPAMNANQIAQLAGQPITLSGFQAPYNGNGNGGNNINLNGTFTVLRAPNATTIVFQTTPRRTLGPATFNNPATRPTVVMPKYTVTTTGQITPQPVVVKGQHFTGTPTVALVGADGTSYPQTVSAGATDTQFTVQLQVGATPNAVTPGVYQLLVTANGHTSVNGITIHALGTNINGATYQPTLIQVNPPAAEAANSTVRNGFDPARGNRLNFDAVNSVVDTRYDAASNMTAAEDVVQKALDMAALYAPAGNNPAVAPLVVVWPKDRTKVPSTNALGDYFENLVVGGPVQLQGVGTGGFQGTGTTATYVDGSRINGLGFNADNLNGTQWINTVTNLGFDPTTVPDGATVTVLGGNAFDRSTPPISVTGAGPRALYLSTHRSTIDGLTITGGDEGGAGLANQNTITGANQTPVGGVGALQSQGSGVYLYGHGTNVQISNNVIDGNSGAYAGGIRVGTPYTANQNGTTGAADANTGVTITHNRVTNNGGTNLAGGIGLFDGSTNYSVDHNDICGNFSSEYGGGISHYGRSNGGSITSNRVYLNQSYDEGGGVMVAGELNANLNQASLGAAAPNSSITIDGNLIQSNLGNDDGGGVRFLQAGDVPIYVTNNTVTDNISAHEGGGFALDDTSNVRLIGNTVMKNITTATAVTSNGLPAPAGLSTAAYSTQFQAQLTSAGSARASARYSRPVIQDDIFVDNRAGTFDTATGAVHGIGQAGDTAPINDWEIGSLDTLVNGNTSTAIVVPASYVVLPASPGSGVSATNVRTAPTNLTALVVNPFEVGVSILNSRTFPAFRQAVIVTQLAPPSLLGNYHLVTGSTAVNTGTDGTGQAANYGHDIDGQNRPRGNGYDIGSDEL